MSEVLDNNSNSNSKEECNDNNHDDLYDDDMSDLSDNDLIPTKGNCDPNNNDNDEDTNEEVNRDPFDRDAHLLQLRFEAATLSLDEVPYERDLNRINTASAIDRKTLFQASKLRKQVDQIKGILTPEDLERIKNGENHGHRNRNRRRKGGVEGNDGPEAPVIIKRDIYEVPTSARRRVVQTYTNTNQSYNNDTGNQFKSDKRRQMPSISTPAQSPSPAFDNGNGKRRGNKKNKDKKQEAPTIFRGIMQNPNRDHFQTKAYYNNDIYLNPAAQEFVPPGIQTTNYADNTLFLNAAAPEFVPSFGKSSVPS